MKSFDPCMANSIHLRNFATSSWMVEEYVAMSEPIRFDEPRSAPHLSYRAAVCWGRDNACFIVKHQGGDIDLLYEILIVNRVKNLATKGGRQHLTQFSQKLGKQYGMENGRLSLVT
jgi:hypothetical protein